ncbi:hypothetical protein [uncultured Nonlabens sp.]|uniref:hypothetical protein n=1 Tax=uncultured Nonlabens sp. TaxID=859306 RepID=UPI0026148677|nr:hypothetical protein [uncultured Nonlabens sp.]
MKKLFTLTLVFILGLGFSSAKKLDDDTRYRNYSKNFIFNQDGIEFAVFPDGQFDFNYLQDRNGVNVFVNTRNVQFSFNSGYDYDRYVQYDSYGAVIQIEEIPIYYDSYGRVNQIGNVNIDYNNGYINRLGGLRVYYSRPGVIHYYEGYINTYNRNYIYQPWHNHYRVPVVNRCVIYNTPYRACYLPIRYSWSYHVNYWNTPTYYNGRYERANARRNFYRPNDRVTYRSFERGRRNSRGRAVAVNNRVNRNRQSISTGRSQVTRTTRGRNVATSTRVATGRNTTSNSRFNRATTRTSRQANTRTISNRGTTRSTTATPRSNRTTRSTTAISSNRNRTVRTTARSTPRRNTARTRSTRGTKSRTTSRGSSSRNTQGISSRSTSSSNKKTSRNTRSRNGRRG